METRNFPLISLESDSDEKLKKSFPTVQHLQSLKNGAYKLVKVGKSQSKSEV